MEYYDDKVHQVAQIIADETEHYIQFHRGLDSVSANKIRKAAKAVVEFLSEEKETVEDMTKCKFKVGDRIVVDKDCNATGERVYSNDGKEFTITAITTPMERWNSDFDFDYVIICNHEWFRDCDVNLVEGEKDTSYTPKDSDTTFLFFKETGKWKYEGRGWFPQTLEVNRETIMATNGGQMPGISSSGDDYVIVVIPDEDSEAEFAYPRLIKPVG